MAVDFLEFIDAEGQVVERLDAIRDLFGATCADQCRGHTLVSERPGERHLRERLAAPLGDGVELACALEILRREQRPIKEMADRRATACGDAGQIFVGQQALRQRRENDRADASALAEAGRADPAPVSPSWRR